MNYILFDDNSRISLLPLTFTRPVAEIRVGILTIREKWEKMLHAKLSFRTEDYLAKKYPAEFAIDTDNLWINGSFCPNAKLVEDISTLKTGQVLMAGTAVVAANTGNEKAFDPNADMTKFESHAQAMRIENPWDIFSKNGDAIKADFDLPTKGRKSLALSPSNQVIGVENIFV